MSTNTNSHPTMDGYKVFEPDWTCRGYQYAPKVGIIHKFDQPLVMGQSGLHFCLRALDCLHYVTYPLDQKNKYAKVRGHDQLLTSHDKVVTNQLEILAEVSYEDFAKLCTGQMITYDGNDQHKVSMVTYHNGVKNANFEYYYPTGLVKKQGRYNSQGQITGCVDEFASDGRLTKFIHYHNNKIVETEGVFYRDQRIHISKYTFYNYQQLCEFINSDRSDESYDRIVNPDYDPYIAYFDIEISE